MPRPNYKEKIIHFVVPILYQNPCYFFESPNGTEPVLKIRLRSYLHYQSNMLMLKYNFVNAILRN